MNNKELCQFLVTAKKQTYAAGDQAQKTVEKDKSTTLTFEQGDWRYHDNYFGGEPFGGREVVFFQDQPVYIMTYYGRVSESIANPEQVYGILQKALSQIPEDRPFRGPKQLTEGSFSYRNSFSGEVDNFSGEVVITRDGQVIYTAKYAGGLLDQRR